MKKVGELMDRLFIDDALVEKGYQRCLEGHELVARVATLERRGGPCPVCGVPFNLVIVDNKFGQFDYYQPSCRCYKRCESVKIREKKKDGSYGRLLGEVEGCGRWLIAEKLTNIDYCTSCNAEDPNPKQKHTPKTVERKIIGKDLATGERDDS